MSVHRVVMLQSIPSIGEFYENVIHLDNPDGTLTDLQIAQELEANFCVSIRQFQSDFLGWQFLYVSDMAHPELGSFIYPMNNQGGLVHVGYVYPTLCYKLKWNVAGTGRRKQGRFFIAGGRIDWMTPGGITASAALNGGIHLQGIVDRYKSGGTGPLTLGTWSVDGLHHPLLSATLWQYMGQQRRRNYGVGM